MKQRIIIKNFGPIKDVDLEINDFMVFIGPQASGKSTIAKLVYFFRDVDENFNLFIKNQDVVENFIVEYSGEIFADLIHTFEHYYYEGDYSLTFYYTSSKFISIKASNKWSNVSIDFSKDLENEAKETYTLSKEALSDFPKNNVPLSREQRELKRDILRDLKIRSNLLFEKATVPETTFIPDNRSNYQNEEGYNFFRWAFRSSILDVQYELSQTQKPKEYSLAGNVLAREILKGEYNYNEDLKDHILLPNGGFIPLSDASSGQKEAVWIVQYIQKALIEKSSAFTIIEEPEAHLFPAAQKSLTELIALLANSAENQVMLTTHSPYILAAINNLMQAYKAGQSHPEKTNEIINKELWLDPKRVSAYFVGGEGNEGKIRDIFDKGLNSIAIEEIDSISEVFNSDYDKLSNLEYNVVS